MGRSSIRRSVVACALAACAVAVHGAKEAKSPEEIAAQKQINQAASLEAMTKWASVLSNAFFASGSPDKAVANIAEFHHLMKAEMDTQSKKWSSFQAKTKAGDGIDFAADLQKVIADGGILRHPVPEISISDPVFFADGTANVSAVAAGASLSSSFINYQPCLVPLTPYAAGIFPQGINVQPELVGVNPQASNIQPQGLSVAPTGILVAPIAANIQPQGFSIAPALFSISPIRTVIAPTGVSIAPVAIAITFPRDGQGEPTVVIGGGSGGGSSSGTSSGGGDAGGATATTGAGAGAGAGK